MRKFEMLRQNEPDLRVLGRLGTTIRTFQGKLKGKVNKKLSFTILQTRT